MNGNNIDIKTASRARSAVKTVLKKYRLSWRQVSQNNALLAWDALGGIWKGKKVPDPSVWQRKIRREWNRDVL